LFSFAVAITAKDRPITIRFEREFGDFGAAFGTGPIAFNHWTLAEVVSVIHFI
jgi:hypothetical protein